MFTGIVTHMGTIRAVENCDAGKRFTIAVDWDYQSLAVGASVAHAGVCLTVVNIDRASKTYQVEAWEEALRLTTAGQWQVGTRLNLERALRMGDELGGHMVLGHIDGRAKIVDMDEQGDAMRFVLEAPAHLSRFIAGKGSVVLDGVSLTVNTVDADCFDVLLIAHTLQVTTWVQRDIGDKVNLEVDMMARYAERLITSGIMQKSE